MTKNRLYRTLKNVVRPITNGHSLQSPTTINAMVIIRSTDTLFSTTIMTFALFYSSNMTCYMCVDSLCKAVVSR